MKKKKHRSRKLIRKKIHRSRAIVKVAPVPIQAKEPDYLRQAALRAPSIQETVEKHREIRHFLRRMLKRDIDYGQIPGTAGKTLYQPGAEKIALWLKVRPYFEKVESDLGNGHIEVISRCHLLPLLVYDLIMGIVEKGVGDVEKAVAAIIRASELSNAEASCSTMETNFRFRWADMRDEQGNPITPNKLEAARKIAINMARWIPAKMKNGQIVAMTPADKKKGVPAEYWLYQERVENPNIHDERHKIRQMGEKRAFVKAIKRMGALSEVFQEDPNEWPEVLDVKPEKTPEEPFKPGQVERDTPAPLPAPPNAPASAAAPNTPHSTGKPGIITVTWQTKDVARLGEDAKDLGQQIVAKFLGIKLEGKEEYIVPASHIPDFCQYAHELGYQIQEQPLLESKKPSREPSPEANEEKGTIENCKAPQEGRKSYSVKFNGAWIYAYSKTVGGHLLGAIGQNARLLVKRTEGKPPVIEGILQLGNTFFDSDGKTPEIQQSQREAGQKTLY